MQIRKWFVSFVIILILCLILLHVCSTKVNAEQNWRVRVIETHIEHHMSLVIVRDFQTKKDYLIVNTFGSNPVAITPLLETK